MNTPVYVRHFCLCSYGIEVFSLIQTFYKLASSRLVEFFSRESESAWRPILVMATLSGIANGILLAVINASAGTTSQLSLNLRFLAIFLLAFFLFYYTKKTAMTRSTIIVEQVLRSVRVRIADKIRSSSLSGYEGIGRELIFSRITQESTTISQSAPILINACQSAIMLVFVGIYILYLSQAALLISVVSIMGGMMMYLAHHQQVSRELRETDRKEREFLASLDQMMQGFKEMKLNRRKSDDLFAHFKDIASESERLRIRTGTLYVTDFMFSQVAFYLLLACLIFLLPRFSDTSTATIIQLTASILFIMGPLETFISAIPFFAKADVAAANLQELENRLDAAHDMAAPEKTLKEPAAFSVISFEDVMFRYTDPDGRQLFSVGPINEEVRQGEILFVVGGNGSGKSTFLKLLTGLYAPRSGTIRVDGRPLEPEDTASYRERFSIVFTDFHLFGRLYGLEQIDTERVHRLLREMDLDQKTAFVDGAFSNVNLSTGQRKRLAIIAALLDDRSIFVFDEVAADQDPAFRKYFYETFLATLKHSGNTVVAVSHDDRYFHVADRILRMDYGKVIKEGV
jgi:putative pyoverdin transport system ATP-binding/permease protein